MAPSGCAPQDLLRECDAHVGPAHPAEQVEPLVSLAFGARPELAHERQERCDRGAQHHDDRSVQHSGRINGLPAVLVTGVVFVVCVVDKPNGCRGENDYEERRPHPWPLREPEGDVSGKVLSHGSPPQGCVPATAGRRSTGAWMRPTGAVSGNGSKVRVVMVLG